MAKQLNVKANEGSTFIVQFQFFVRDADGVESSMVPNPGLSWTLSDENGTPVNSRLAVPIDPPASTIFVVLSGDDLALDANYPAKRFLVVEGTFNSEYGLDLPFNHEVSFFIDNLEGV